MDPDDQLVSIELAVTTPALLKAIGLLAIHFPEKFHLEAWRALTAESAQREVGLPARPIVLARQRFAELPFDVQAVLRGR